MSERQSGNTSNDVYNEINVIIDELVKKKIYTKSEGLQLLKAISL